MKLQTTFEQLGFLPPQTYIRADPRGAEYGSYKAAPRKDGGIVVTYEPEAFSSLPFTMRFDDERQFARWVSHTF